MWRVVPRPDQELYRSLIWGSKVLALFFPPTNYFKSCTPKRVYRKTSHIATKIPFMCSLSGNSAASAPISTFMCTVSNLYIPKIGPHISCNRIGRSIVGIYKSLTDTWMWKFLLGLWPCNSFSGNICFEFLVLDHCSAWCRLPELSDEKCTIPSTEENDQEWKGRYALASQHNWYGGGGGV